MIAADPDGVAQPPEDPYFVSLGPTLAGREAGQSARDAAENLRAAAPWRAWVARVAGLHTDERAWRKGARGEQLVARELAKLPPDRWFAFHDIPIGERGANVDHLVIGQGGVFSLNAKNLSGTVWVAERALLHNGHRTDFLPKARQEASRVSKLLSRALGRPVPVRGVLVVMCERISIKAEPADVKIVTRSRVAKWLGEQPLRLSRHEAIEIAGKAHQPATWGARRQ